MLDLLGNFTVSSSESMLAHFLQRSLIEPKRRDASWTNEELNAFKEMVRQKVRQVPASTQSPNAGFAHTIHPSSQPPNQYDFIMSNMASECPGCANGYPFLPNPPEATSNSLKRKGPTVKARNLRLTCSKYNFSLEAVLPFPANVLDPLDRDKLTTVRTCV